MFLCGIFVDSPITQIGKQKMAFIPKQVNRSRLKRRQTSLYALNMYHNFFYQFRGKYVYSLQNTSFFFSSPKKQYIYYLGYYKHVENNTSNQDHIDMRPTMPKPPI